MPLDFSKSLSTARLFEPTPVREEVVRDVLEVARWSGSARNRQPRDSLVVRDHNTLERLIAPTPAISAVLNARPC